MSLSDAKEKKIVYNTDKKLTPTKEKDNDNKFK